jgi:hypothetical protein
MICLKYSLFVTNHSLGGIATALGAAFCSGAGSHHYGKRCHEYECKDQPFHLVVFLE